MRLHKNETIQSYTFLIIFLLLIEISFRLISGLKIDGIVLTRIILANSILSLVISYLTSFLKQKKAYIINLIVILIFSIYAWLQLGFNSYIGVYMSFSTTSQLGAVKSYIMEFLSAMKPIYHLVFIPFLFSLIIYFLGKKIISKNPNLFLLKKKYSFHNSIVFIEVILLLFSFGIGFYELLDSKYSGDSYQVVSNKDLFLSDSNPGLFIKEFGIVPFSIMDLNAKYVGVTENSSLSYLAYEDNVVTQREFDDTNWEILISEEKNKKYNEINNYYINNLITDKNIMTGLFKDKNLIVIMLESVNDVIINKEYFPNFYKMLSEGWHFENNYSPRNSCATGNNEFSSMTGLYSVYNTCTANVYKNNTYFTSIFNLFNNAGYYTNSLHNFTEGYYYRSTIHKNMGSQKYYGVQDLGIPYYKYYGGWASDIDLMNRYLEIIDNDMPKNKFMTYITTVTSHQPFSASSPYGDMNLDMTEGTDYSMDMRRYMSKLKVLDDALGVLLDGLETRGILDDTVIAMFGDHYPYGIKNEILNEVLDRSLDDYENERVPFVIYNSELESFKYDMYTSYLNLTPTLANLFDLDFDPRYYAGVDVFSDAFEDFVVFADSSWKNSKAYYNAATSEITYYKDFEYTDEEIKNINAMIYTKTNASSLSIKNNYFSYLEKKLKEIEERNIIEE